MPASITPAGGAAINFTVMRGDIPPLGKVFETIQRKGVTGSAYRDLGRIGPVARLRLLRDEDTTATAEAFFTNTKAALEGKLCTVVDHNGTSTPNVMVLSVERVGVPKRTPAASGGLSALMGAIIEMEATVQVAKA